jgi:ABC-type transporter Mla MlaB component
MESRRGQQVAHGEAGQSAQQDNEDKEMTFEQKEAYRMMMELSEKTLVEILFERELSVVQFGAELMMGIWDKKIKAEDLWKILCKKLLNTDNVLALDMEFAKEVKKKPGIKKEIKHIDKRQKTMVHLFNIQMEIAAYMDYLRCKG